MCIPSVGHGLALKHCPDEEGIKTFLFAVLAERPSFETLP